MAACLPDTRQAAKVRHQVQELVTQRVFQIAAAYEDCNDATQLRRDPVPKTVVGCLPQSGHDLASLPTLSRLGNSMGRRELWRMAQVLVARLRQAWPRTRDSWPHPRRIWLGFGLPGAGPVAGPAAAPPTATRTHRHDEVHG
ncbi:MAG: transposase [Armatimonadia bacterium]